MHCTGLALIAILSVAACTSSNGGRAGAGGSPGSSGPTGASGTTHSAAGTGGADARSGASAGLGGVGGTHSQGAGGSATRDGSVAIGGNGGVSVGAGTGALGVTTAVSPAQRLEQLSRATRSEFAERLRTTSPDELVAMAREGVRRLGTYRARVAKQERVHQKLLPAQTFELLVRPWPKALRLEYVEGVGAGREVVWTEKRPKEILVREGGQRGATPVWLDADSSLAHRDTNHNVAEFGFAPILEILASDLVNATQYGGHHRTEEGFDVSGSYCMTLTAPTSAQGLYARRVRLCIDRGLAVPVKIEIYDALGFLERYTYSNIRADQQLQPAMFENL